MLNEILKNHKVVINCGCGGVGKTTTSAALGIRAAQLGLNVIVLTIDPARRLADSLGIGELTNKPKIVSLPKEIPGKMSAMMLDVKNTIDALVERNAKSPEQVQRVFSNHIYQQLSQTMGGGQEYGAMESLYQLHSEDQYELIVLDTPPSQHAIDFITAPLKLKEFFGQSVLKFFLEGAKEQEDRNTRGWSLASRGGSLALKLFEKLTGSHFLGDVSEFLGGFHGMYEAIRDEAGHVSDLIGSPETAFLVVTSPDQQQLSESRTLIEKLGEFLLPFKGVIINKCTPELEAKLDSSLPNILIATLEHMLLLHQRQYTHETELIQSMLAGVIQNAFISKIPIFPTDVHNLDSLIAFNAVIKS
ncbi:ArsA-related P-loop ATPase [Deltaproteobacteria bacterium TL4]